MADEILRDKVLVEFRKMIGEFMAARRKQLNISLEELAGKTGMRPSTIQRFEEGKFWMNMKQFILLCFYLKCYHFIEAAESDSERVTSLRNRWKRPDDAN